MITLFGAVWSPDGLLAVLILKLLMRAELAPYMDFLDLLDTADESLPVAPNASIP